MNRRLVGALTAMLAGMTIHAIAAQKSNEAAYQENEAVIVVTGMRLDEDPRTKLRCRVYAVYPLDNYHKLGGRQVQ